jgi:hypothetical protein
MKKAQNIFFIGLLFLSIITSNAQNKMADKKVCSNDVFSVSEIADEFRHAKNIRYNSDGIDLTKRDPNIDYFITHITPRGLSPLPIEESSDIVVGKVIKIQPFFSEDKSQIYTEITVNVEEVLKKSSNLFSESKMLTLTELGGAIKLGSGKVIRYEINVDSKEIICNEKRYLLFIETTNENKDFRFIKLYGLHNEMVYAFEKGQEYLVSKKSKSLPDKEDKFLDNLRSIIKSQP